MITQERVKFLFTYHEDGYLIWNIDVYSNKVKGKKVGSRNSSGRLNTTIDNKNYLVSRLIFLWHKGWLPKIVDHKDRNGNNNKIENLRAADYSQNAVNTTSRKNSTSKYLGVCFHGRDKNWMAQHMVNGKKIHLGNFDSEIEAAKAYNKSVLFHFGEFANLNVFES